TDAHDVCDLIVDRIDVTEVECLISNVELLPGCAGISRAQHSRSRPTGPRHPFTHSTHPAQPRRDPTRLRGPSWCNKHNQHKHWRNNLHRSPRAALVLRT